MSLWSQYGYSKERMKDTANFTTSYGFPTLYMSLKIRISVIQVSRTKDEHNKTKRTRIWESALTTNADPESKSGAIAWYGRCILRQKPQTHFALPKKKKHPKCLAFCRCYSHINTILVYQHLHVHLDTCSSVESPEVFSMWSKVQEGC